MSSVLTPDMSVARSVSVELGTSIDDRGREIQDTATAMLKETELSNIFSNLYPAPNDHCNFNNFVYTSRHHTV